MTVPLLDDVTPQTPPASKRRDRTKPTSSIPSAGASRPQAETTDATDTAGTDEPTTASPPVRSDASTPPTSTVTVASETVPSAAVLEPEPDAPATVPHKPADSMVAAITSLVTSLISPFAGNAPTAPAQSPAMWTLLAAARRETFGTSPTLSAVGNPVTTALTTTEPIAPAPSPVVAIPQVAPLAWLQQIPILGPIVVTPIVEFIHQIPIISDVLHPFIGYPVQWGRPHGSPVSRDVKVISFDGTPIYVHFMPAAGLHAGQKAPTVLYGPGLGMPGATNLNGTVVDDILTDAVGMVSIATLRAAGYNVVTWDPRGEWRSGGVLELNSPEFEARDVSAIISWVAAQPEARLDSAIGLDPRIGMVGVSYGGGIQLVTAATDHRVDAIVPTIAWNSLNSSLYKAGAFKSGWGTLLSGALVFTLADVNPRIYPAAIVGALIGAMSQADQDLLAERGPDFLLDNITAPTLLIQGTVDTLFTLQEANATALALIENGVPTKVVWFCGGHGACLNNLFDLSDGALIERRTLEWLDLYVKGVPVSTGPQFEWVDQNGQWFSSENYVLPQGDPLVATLNGGATLPLLPYLGGSGLPFVPLSFKAINAVNLTVPAAATTTYLVGAPELTLTYSGTGVSRHVYAQLVDDTTGLVLGYVVTPIPVTLDGQTHTVTVALEQVAHTLRPGQTVTLQLVSTAGLYATVVPPLGVLNVSSMQLTLPAVDAAAVSPSSTRQLAHASAA
ncbi:CocE/NonD family hydrolase [Mycolicibacterium sp. 624]|uniref:CocE/NonD family hydrolase n=1 Tax=Mycolicibacterium sp. 624 TaxID=3156314 RepID=UPI0033971C2A